MKWKGRANRIFMFAHRKASISILCVFEFPEAKN